VAFAALARGVGSPATIAEATDALNRGQVDRLEQLVRSQLRPGGAVGILGLSYKPATSVVEESQGVELARKLAEGGVPVAVYDPQAMATARGILGDLVSYASTPGSCAAAADVLVVATPWEEFKDLDPSTLRPGSVVLDCWRVLPEERFAARVSYRVLGRGGY
jgi:UDPglucose 6-dehydrogenase